jgi:hypothetical protein
MLADEEAEAIRKGLAEGWRGPILLRWFEHFLKDRDERRQKEREAPLTQEGPALSSLGCGSLGGEWCLRVTRGESHGKGLIPIRVASISPGPVKTCVPSVL